MKKRIRFTIDISMTVLLPLLMAYSLIGEAFHEVVGTAMFVLFIVHHILNRKWYGALFKGKYTARRVFQTVLNTLLLVVMILQPVSGILMSKHLFTFLPSLPISAQVRSIHMLLAYWGYVLMCLHAGTHLTSPLAILGQKSKKVSVTLYVILGCISIYGHLCSGVSLDICREKQRLPSLTMESRSCCSFLITLQSWCCL